MKPAFKKVAPAKKAAKTTPAKKVAKKASTKIAKKAPAVVLVKSKTAAPVKVDPSELFSVSQLSVKNIRSLGNLSIAFTDNEGALRPWTLLLGKNGTGKTTLLRCLALILAGGQSYRELLGNPNSWIRNGADEATISGTLKAPDGKTHRHVIRLKRSTDPEDKEARQAEGFGKVYRVLVAGYGVSRRTSSARLAGLENRPYSLPVAQRVATLFQPDARLRSLESWAVDLEYQHGDKGVDLVRSVLDRMMRGPTFRRIDRQSKRVFFNTEDGEVPFEQLSDGFQNVASWCGDFISRLTEFYGFGKERNAPALLLIDEVDLHLHPVWQREVREFIQREFPNVQVVATTHSALTAHQCQEGELFVLERVKEGVSVEQYGGDPSSLLLHQFLLSPVFAFETADSREAELLRAKFIRERKQGKASPELIAEVGALPEWPVPGLVDDKDRELLKRIEAALKEPDR